MKTLEEYKKELEQDPKARRRLKKLEKEFEAVEESLTEEELIKYGLKPADGLTQSDNENGLKPAEDKETANNEKTAENAAVSSVLDSISRKI